MRFYWGSESAVSGAQYSSNSNCKIQLFSSIYPVLSDLNILHRINFPPKSCILLISFLNIPPTSFPVSLKKMRDPGNEVDIPPQQNLLIGPGRLPLLCSVNGKAIDLTNILSKHEANRNESSVGIVKRFLAFDWHLLRILIGSSRFLHLL